MDKPWIGLQYHYAIGDYIMLLCYTVILDIMATTNTGFMYAWLTSLSFRCNYTKWYVIGWCVASNSLRTYCNLPNAFPWLYDMGYHLWINNMGIVIVSTYFLSSCGSCAIFKLALGGYGVQLIAEKINLYSLTYHILNYWLSILSGAETGHFIDPNFRT